MILIGRILLYSLLLFFYHLFLLVLPVNLFVIGLKIPAFMSLTPWIFYPFLFFSPVLSIYLAARSCPSDLKRFDWAFPVLVVLIGYLPFTVSYFLTASPINVPDYLLFFFVPVLIGLLPFWGLCFFGSSRLRRLFSVSKLRQKSPSGHSGHRGVK